MPLTHLTYLPCVVVFDNFHEADTTPAHRAAFAQGLEEVPDRITVIDRAGHTEFLGFPDRFVCNLAFGGKDMRDCWLMLSGLGKIAKVRWPAPGQTPVFRA